MKRKNAKLHKLYYIYIIGIMKNDKYGYDNLKTRAQFKRIHPM